MLTSRPPSSRTLAYVFGGITSLALLIASIAYLLSVTRSTRQNDPAPTTPATPTPSAVTASAVIHPSTSARRFTLRLGQGFRFHDAALVVANPNERPDITFKYLPPQVGGMALRYNPISQQVEQGLEPTLTSPVPLLLATRIKAFDDRPNVARTTTGDIATYPNQAPFSSKNRYLLLQSQPGDAYLLTLDQLEAVPGKYDDWRIGFAYEPVQLPLGLAGGKINAPFPGKLIFRDWYRSKMIVRVDLTTGKEEAIADGTLPSTVGERLLGYGDPSSAYVVRDAAGKILHTIRFNERLLGPLLSPDGTRLLGSVYRAPPGRTIGSVTVPGAAVLSVGVFDLTGREIASVIGYDDATWSPDGKIIATGTLYEPGLFEIDPATKNVRPIDATIGTPFQPNVSPDGKTIAFVTGNRVWLIDRDGKNLRQILRDAHNQQRPAFSPDGTRLAVVICNQFPIDDSGEIFVVDLKTQDITPLRTSTGASLLPDTSSRLNWIP